MLKLKFVTKFFLRMIVFTVFIFMMINCGINENGGALKVKFTNSKESTYTINTIELMDMGSASAGESKASNIWSDNILKDGKTIAPGESVFFTIDIPNGDYSQYRIGVIDNNNTIMLHEQAGYQEGMKPTITHWGGDDRTVDVTVYKNPSTNLITIRAYGDWVGIEE